MTIAIVLAACFAALIIMFYFTYGLVRYLRERAEKSGDINAEDIFAITAIGGAILFFALCIASVMFVTIVYGLSQIFA